MMWYFNIACFHVFLRKKRRFICHISDIGSNIAMAYIENELWFHSDYSTQNHK